MPEERKAAIHAKRALRYKESVDKDMLTFDTLLADYPSYPKAPVIGFISENPSSAVLKYYLLNGCMDFHKANTLQELDGNGEDKEKYDSTVKELVNELRGQIPSAATLEDMRKKYIDDTGIANKGNDNVVTYTNMCCCGCCGVKELDVNKEFKKVPLSALDLLLVPQASPYRSILENPWVKVPADDKGTMKELDLRLAMNWYDDVLSGKLYWLHPEFVQTEQDTDSVANGEMTDTTIPLGSTWLCKSCFRSLCGPGTPSIPANSLAKVNFGSARRLGLPELNPLTRMVISKIRNHRIVLKLLANNLGRTDGTGSTLRGHYIMFNHDAPNVLAKEFLKLESFADIFTVHMICEDGKSDWMLQRAWQTQAINIQSHVAYQYLLVLKRLHKEYHELELPEFEEFKKTIESLKDSMKENTILDESTVIAQLEDNIGADVANVRSERRQGPLVEEDAGEEMVDEDVMVVDEDEVTNGNVVVVDEGEETNLHETDNPDPCLGSYLVHNPNGDRYQQPQRHKDITLSLLETIGKQLNRQMSGSSEAEPPSGSDESQLGQTAGVTNEMDGGVSGEADAHTNQNAEGLNEHHVGGAMEPGEKILLYGRLWYAL
jgi:hypothetical protein